MAVIVYWTVRIEQFATHVGLYRFDLGIITTTSPALDIAAFKQVVLGLVAGSKLHSDSNLRLLPAITCQLTADSLL